MFDRGYYAEYTIWLSDAQASSFICLFKLNVQANACPLLRYISLKFSVDVVYAIVETGGKQYRVQEGDVLALDRLKGGEGEVIELGRVLLVGGETTTVGTPVVEGASVNAKILEHTRDKKKITFRYRNKSRYRVKKGHRQPITRIQIDSISV